MDFKRLDREGSLKGSPGMRNELCMDDGTSIDAPDLR